MSAPDGAGPLVPTFHGFVHNSMDGLVLFEACLSGKIHHVPRRPHDRERSTLIKSGSIFIYEENASGIKRWTDGVAWSPSRILGNFLIYRELEKPFPPGEKKRAMKRKRTVLPGEPCSRRESDDAEVENSEFTSPLTPPTPKTAPEVKSDIASNDQDKELERSLIGSLVDSYGFRPDGLVKKTMSISIHGISHHMVSYYKVDDVKNEVLPRPLTDQRLQHVSVRPELYLKQNFRAPVEETEHYAVDSHMNAHPNIIYGSMSAQAYGVRPGQYFAGQYAMPYAITSSAGNVYGGLTGTSWPTQTTTASAYSEHPVYAQNYTNYYKPSPGQIQPGQVKSEDHPSSAGGYDSSSYPTTYSGAQRNGAQSTPGMMQSSYSAPLRQDSSNFGSMSAPGAPAQYRGGSSPAIANGQSHHMYSNSQSSQNFPSQQYAVRSPSQNYQMQSNPAPSSAVAQSPHPGIKSPAQQSQSGASAHSMGAPDHQAQMHASQMPYRATSYAMPGVQHSSQPSGDMSGLGISHGAAYAAQPQPQPTQGGISHSSYDGYGGSGQAFRPVGDGSVQPPAHYPQ